MKNFLLGIAVTLSGLALAGSGWTLYQLSQLQNSLQQQQNSFDEQQNLIQEQQNAIAQLVEKVEANQEEISSVAANATKGSQSSRLASSSNSTSSQQSKGIEPGQFVNKGVNNKIEIGLLSVKRIANPDGGAENVVVVQMRVRRIVPKGEVDSISFSQSKGRNPETSEVYRTIRTKSTTYLSINSIPKDAWGNAYFWLRVPEEVNVIDIVIPETAIFKNVPISG